MYDKPVAKSLHDDIMSVGNTIDAGEAFRRFRGRDVKIGALMRNRGFPGSAGGLSRVRRGRRARSRRAPFLLGSNLDISENALDVSGQSGISVSAGISI